MIILKKKTATTTTNKEVRNDTTERGSKLSAPNKRKFKNR